MKHHDESLDIMFCRLTGKSLLRGFSKDGKVLTTKKLEKALFVRVNDINTIREIEYVLENRCVFGEWVLKSASPWPPGLEEFKW